MRDRRQLSLLVLRGDGARVVRFNFPRPLAVAAFVSILAGLGGVVGLAHDWMQLRALTVEARAFQRQLAEQRATIDGVNRRVAELRQEITNWRELHARIWDVFGPELKPGARDRAVGGAAAPAERLPDHLTPRAEIDQLAETVKEHGDSLRALERLLMRASKALAVLPSRWPVRGPVNSEFGMRSSPWNQDREFHAGMDIGASKGTPIKAPADGIVKSAGHQGDYGITVILEHPNEIRTLYGHLSQLKVKAGDRVERGTVIGTVGNTGRSTGSHLHYEVYVKGKPVNPRAWLWD